MHIGFRHALRFGHALAVHGVARVFPKAVGDTRPFVGKRFRLRAQFLGRLFVLQIGRLRARSLHHVDKHARILQDGTWTQVIGIEGLFSVVFHEQRLAQRIE